MPQLRRHSTLGVPAWASKAERLLRYSAHADAYKVETRAGSIFGGIVSAAVLAATVVYVVIVAQQVHRRPPTTTNYVEWSLGRGPFTLKLTCLAEDGCLISNYYSEEYAGPKAAQVPAAQQQCHLVAQNETQELLVLFSSSPMEGLSVLYRANFSQLENGGFKPGFSLLSEAYCGSCPGTVKLTHLPIGPCNIQLTYVKTENSTAEGSARKGRNGLRLLQRWA